MPKGEGGSAKSGGAGLKEMYENWRDASPAKPFPFQHGDIKYTWADVRSRIQKDMNNTALTFATGHFTPGVSQSLVLSDMYKKERSHLERGKEIASEMASNSGRTVSSPSPSRSTLKEKLTAHEAELLYNAEGGGRGRITFLKERKGMAPIARYKLPVLSSHAFGWEIDRETQVTESIKSLASVDPQEALRQQAEQAKLQSKNARADHRRKAGMGGLMRTCGVFYPTEFATFPPFK